MIRMNVKNVSKWLVVLGAIQVGLNEAMGFDLVGTLLGSWPGVVQILYVLVAVSGLWGAYAMATSKRK